MGGGAAVHENRNFGLVLVLTLSSIWAFFAWFVMRDDMPLLLGQQVASLFGVVASAIWLTYALRFEDRLPDHLAEVVGPMYYEVDGLSFMPMVRVRDGQAELCVYYQNRYENKVDAIIHLRPPHQTFTVGAHTQDLHFAFQAGGGDFGVIHQPINVPEHIRGDVLNVELAAASYYPRSHGSCWRRKAGMPCGSFVVDWGGAAFKAGVHEVSGEIELNSPATLHLPMPKASEPCQAHAMIWKQEKIEAGKE